MLAVLGVWVAGLVSALLYGFADLPRTWGGWVAFLFLAPPLTLLLEVMAERISDCGNRISPARFSLLRIAIAVLAMVALLGPLLWWKLRMASG
ncbi:hypothetical protein AnaeK_1086 [Anaeromyxobacter sp. K]|uniref:hypothetical protein n=1 Tax=Anaeromyxobacter sp. (strain K) TaxID=447217 RepID=UPI00015F99D6|nr:hypothetical protein [Anaeromyxobacter sp. K]ACG72321.1 hypothetical protein AnaeK_1086 [Anaeromyxobacter sp. K]